MARKQTVSDAIATYLASLQPHFAPQTILAYGQSMRLFTQLLHKQFHIDTSKHPSNSISVDWAYAYLAYLQDTHSIETEHLYSRTILGFYQHIEGHNHPHLAGIANTLATYLKDNRRSKEHLSPDLPLEAIETILAHVTATAPTAAMTKPQLNRESLRLLRDRAFLLTLAHTGLRVSEICNLRKADVDSIRRTIILSPELSLPLPSTVLATINHYLADRKPLDDLQHLFNSTHLPLFSRHDKKTAKRILPISRWTAANIVTYWANAALSPETQQELTRQKHPISPQTFRHYFVITTLQRTGDLQETQTLARHRDTTTTRRYLRYATQDQDPESQSNQ